LVLFEGTAFALMMRAGHEPAHQVEETARAFIR
jgi:hypothetical protein